MLDIIITDLLFCCETTSNEISKHFDLARKNGHTKTVDMIVQKSAELNIKLFEKEWDSLSASNWVDAKSKESVMASLGKSIFQVKTTQLEGNHLKIS